MLNFPTHQLAVINVQGKILPFKGSGKIQALREDRSERIVNMLEDFAIRGYTSIVIDDYQYVMANEFMRRSAEKGYDKFTEIGRHAWDIANKVTELPNNVIVYIMCHIDRDDDGNEKIKTIGKLLDEKICLEGMSTIVLKTNVTDGVYTFLTQNNGKDTVKSPAGMFPSYAIDNDLYYVDQKIRNYYELGEHVTDDEMEKLDETVKKEDIPMEKKPRRARRTAAVENSSNETNVDEGIVMKPMDISDSSADELPKRKSRDEEPSTEKPKRRRRRQVDQDFTVTQEDMDNLPFD